MLRTSFNRDWKVGEHTNFTNMNTKEGEAVTLPHDAMIMQMRDAKVASAERKAFYPDGAYDYIKTFFVPAEYKEKRVYIEFEGVYANAMVYINNDFAGQHPYGYSNFYIKADRFLKYGEDNLIKVVARSNDDARWYTGTGIYRNTKLIVANPVHIALDGIKITTPEIAYGRAVVAVATTIDNEAASNVKTKIVTELVDANGSVVAADTAPLTSFNGESITLRQRLYVKEPKLWNVDTPHLYTCRTKVLDGEDILDEEETTFGIRSLSLDVESGLSINGEVVKLRGACIHHDNGVIGAATIDRAEERRVELLKAAGFNALRSSHYPMNKAMLRACDRLGMLVMDEAFDVWAESKTPFDYALNFPQWWEKDIEAMINKDFNHPSVIMYSIGNEIPEMRSAEGAARGRKLAEKVKSMDSSRYVINSVNCMFAVIDKLKRDNTTAASGGNFNDLMTNDPMGFYKMIIESGMVGEVTAEAFSSVDIAGYNYAANRYVADLEVFPNRIICGSETFPKDIANNWKLVMENGHVIGDFTWTGWDYLGESGIGRITYEDDAKQENSQQVEYPWLTANCADIDIIGNRRPQSYYREIVFGLRKAPYIAVQRPSVYGKKANITYWGWDDVLASWSWDGFEDKPVKIEVYSDADEVALLVNGSEIGKAAAGAANNYKAEFETIYAPGEIVAIAYINGQETGRHMLQTAGSALSLQVEADRNEIMATDGDLAFIQIALTDEAGIVKPLADREVTVKVEGNGVLQGFGSANPKPLNNYFDTTQLTYNGQALAVVRPTASGSIQVTVTEAEGQTKTVTIKVNRV